MGDVDGQEAAGVMVCVEQRHLLEAVHPITGVVDVQRDGGGCLRETQAIMGSYMVGMHIKIGQLLDALGATKPADKHAAALFVLSASREHRMALSKWMPGGTSSPPEENKLFEPGNALMVFKNLSLGARPGLSECWREYGQET